MEQRKYSVEYVGPSWGQFVRQPDGKKVLTALTNNKKTLLELVDKLNERVKD